MGDLTFDVDINKVADGGVWLHSDAAGRNGVVLITGGLGWGAGVKTYPKGTALYFQIMQNGSLYGPYGELDGVFTSPGVQNTHLHVSVVGNVYTATAENKSISLTTALFATGRVGLYDFSEQTFDNVVLANTVPEPASLTVLGAAAILLLRRRNGGKKAG